ncbi:MAG: hypothetical protein V4731_17805 [Pseudomonadota bacterium]
MTDSTSVLIRGSGLVAAARDVTGVVGVVGVVTVRGRHQPRNRLAAENGRAFIFG